MTWDEQHELDELAEAITTIQPGGTGSVLVGWVCIAEFSSLDGERWLTIRSGAQPESDHFTTSWQRRGYMREVLDTGWVDDPNTSSPTDDDD